MLLLLIGYEVNVLIFPVGKNPIRKKGENKFPLSPFNQPT